MSTERVDQARGRTFFLGAIMRDNLFTRGHMSVVSGGETVLPISADACSSCVQGEVVRSDEITLTKATEGWQTDGAPEVLSIYHNK